MAIRVMTEIAPFWYVLSGQSRWEKDESGKEVEVLDERPSRAKIRPLSGEEYNFLAPELSMRGGNVMISGSGVKYICDKCILEWENFDKADGTELEFSPGNIRYLPHDARLDIASKVIEASHLSEEQGKN